MRTRVVHLLSLPLLAAGLLVLGGARVPIADSVPPDEVRSCRGSLKPPFHIELTPSGQLAASAFNTLEGRLFAESALTGVQIEITTEGGVDLMSPQQITLDPLAAGEERAFQVPVRFGTVDRAAVHVRVTATSRGEEWFRVQTLYTLFLEDRALSGMDGYHNLEIRAIEEDYQSGKITEEAAREAARALRQIRGEWNQNAPTRPFVQEEDGPIKAVTTDGRIAPAGAAGGCITVQGNVSWLDINGNIHPAFGMTVRVMDEDLGFDEEVEVIATDVNGNYFLQVDNDDGILQGDRDIYVQIATVNNAISVEDAGIFGAPYEANSGVYDETPCGAVINESFVCDNTGTGPACGITEGGSWIAVFTASDLNGGSFLSQIVIEWPGTGSSSNYDGGDLNILELDRFDWDVIHHEYGHYIQDHFNIEDNPGGPHGIGDCVSDEHDDKSEGVRLAWAEGWPTYNGTVAQQLLNLAALNIPNVGDVRYTDTEDSSLDYSLESQSTSGMGEDNELAVQRILWDLFDGPSDSRDNVNDSHITLFNTVNAADPTTLSGAWGAIRATLSDAQQLTYGAVSTDHKVGPALNIPAAGTIVSPSNNNNFSWERYVGCSSTYAGDGFTLRFFRTDNAAPILSIPVGNTTSASLALADFQTLVAATHNVTWAVEGSNSSSPATGPYLGESFAIVVNRPPVADAGDDITAECTSPTTTPVQLDGTGSSDPDGDTITWSWSGPGITFDNPNSSTPIGQFPEGTTVVTLTVSDGLEEDTDQVSVTIEDTTPPDITCPMDITIECSDHCLGGGVPSDDPQLTEFFDAVSAVDVCDTDPVITDDRPDCFPLGTTTVTFTACDDDDNCSECTADVTVEDTTPPEIAVELNREVLWPPNHKLATITAEVVVTDICDPNPTYVLTSIESNEPDDGLGDGDTENDIQEADFGMADTEFLLRSERAGVGDGRKYTIIYTASDQSGNTASDTVCVRVPHDQSGMAMSSSGFDAEGTWFEPSAIRYQVLILSRPDFDASRIDGHNTYVGNHIGALRPVTCRFLDLNGDRSIDLELSYDVGLTQQLRAESHRRFPLGLHYTAGSVDYLVHDIFDLGTPMIFVNEDPVGDGGKGDVPEQEEAEDPDGGLGMEPDRDDPAPAGAIVLAEPGLVRVEVFDVTGRKIRSLLNSELGAGTHLLPWDGRDDNGQRVPSGMYFYRIDGPGLGTVRKIQLVK